MGKEVEFLLLFSTERKKHSGMDEAFGVGFLVPTSPVCSS